MSCNKCQVATWWWIFDIQVVTCEIFQDTSGTGLTEDTIKSIPNDNEYLKSFKTTKEKNKAKDSNDNLAKEKGKKFLKTVYKNTPGGPGDTPSGNDSLPKMKVSKENLIKISTEPVANYYSIVKDLGHGSYGQVKKVKHKQLNEIRAMKITNKKKKTRFI